MKRRGRRSLSWLAPAIAFTPAIAFAAPEVSFTASRTADCVAPCAVSFDATATRDASAPHPFHDLDFAWSFGDERAGRWALSGLSKDGAIGGIAGHLYERAGSYVVKLRVTNAAGESGEAERSVVVADPDVVFRGAATTCVSAAGRFDGCPDGAARVTGRELSDAIANAPGRRTLLRRGERFAWSRAIRLADAGASASSIGVFGPGEQRATLAAGAGATFDPGDGWRLAHLELTGPGADAQLAPFTEHDGVDGFTLHDLVVRGFNACVEFWSPMRPNRAVAMVDVACGGFPDPGSGAKFYEDTEDSMFLGLDLDKGEHRDPKDQTEFAYRTVFSNKKLIQHGRFRGRAPNQSKNLLQLRHCSAVGPWLERCRDGEAPSRFVIVSDNHFIEGAGPHALTVVRTCDHGACTGRPGESQRLEDYVFERNLFQVDARDPADQLASVFQLQGSRISVRHNVADLQGWPRGGPPRAFFALVDAVSNPTRDRQEAVRIHHNTLYFGSGFAKPIVLCATRAAQADLACSDNLVYAPGADTSFVLGTSWKATGNASAAANPFPAAPPGPLAASRRDLAAFAVKAGGPGAAVREPARPGPP